MRNLLLNTLTIPTKLISETEITAGFGATKDSQHSRFKRWVKQGKLLRIRRGLYYVVDEIAYRDNKPNPLEIAQYIYGPSYISFELALSYHHLIPEAVYTITSACIKRTKEFHTPIGVFSYMCLPNDNFYLDVELIEQNNARFFIAKPWKAICDYVYFYKKDWEDRAPLYQSLRIEPEDLPPLDQTAKERLIDYYQQKRIQRFLKGV